MLKNSEEFELVTAIQNECAQIKEEAEKSEIEKEIEKVYENHNEFRRAY